jgi:hypothetical protein
MNSKKLKTQILKCVTTYYRTMASQLNLFKIIGDSNTRNAFSTRLKLCERITGQTTEFISASAYSSGLAALTNLDNATVVYVSFLTNGLTDATELCSDLGEIDGVIQQKIVEYSVALRMACSINSSTKVFMMPPMTRTTPFWIESKLSQITTFIASQVQDIENLTLLPPMAVTKENLEADGVHLNRESQSRLFTYIMEALFPDKISTKTKNVSRDRDDSDADMGTPPTKKTSVDSLFAIPSLESSSSQSYLVSPLPSQVINEALESADSGANNPIGNQDDLIAASSLPSSNSGPDDSSELSNPDLQQLYQMLSRKIDMVKGSSSTVQSKVDAVQRQVSATTLKVEFNSQILRSLHVRTAVQAETLDAHSNTLNLNFVMISGVPSTLISSQEGELPGIKFVMDKLIKYTPLLVSGVKFAVYAKYIKHQEGKLPNIKACFINADTALAFRDAANKLRVAKKDFWSSVYVSNDPTKSTRVRISILQALSKRLAPLPANNGKTIFVSRFDVKPQLCFKFGGRVERRLDFVPAMEKYRSLLQAEDKEAARKVAGKTFSEDELRQFLVL